MFSNLAKHRYLPSCKSTSEFLLYLWVVFIDLQDLVLKLLGVVYVVFTSHKHDSATMVITAIMKYLLIRGGLAPTKCCLGGL